MLKTSFWPVEYINNLDLHSFFSTQDFFVRFLDPADTDIITGTVVIVLHYEFRTDFPYITKQMGCCRVSIFSQCSGLHEKPRETKHLFFEKPVIFPADLCFKYGRTEWGIGPCFFKVIDELVFCYSNQSAKLKCIKTFNLLGYH